MMSVNYCRLCINIGLDFKSLYDAQGQVNEVYELTTKYFDRSILNLDEGKDLTKICLQCWDQICDFNNFQQAVHVAQSTLDVFKQREIAKYIEKPDTNGAQQDLDHSICKADKKEDYNSHLEFEESELPNDTNTYAASLKNQRIELNDPLNVNTNELDYNDIDATMVVGEFTIQNVIIAQQKLDIIDINNDSNNSFDEISEVKTPETLSAYESDNNNQSLEYSAAKNRCIYNTNSSNGGQSPSSNNQIQKGESNEEYNIYTPKLLQRFECSICSDICYQYHNLREHFKRMHPSKHIQISCCLLDHSGFNGISQHLISHYFICNLCGNRCGRLAPLMRHIARHHPGVSEEYVETLQQWSNSSFPCHECGKNITTLHSFRRHICLQHPNREHKCQICERIFNKPLDLREHMTAHTGENLYTCPHCQMEFKKRFALYQHKKRTHGNQTRARTKT